MVILGTYMNKSYTDLKQLTIIITQHTHHHLPGLLLLPHYPLLPTVYLGQLYKCLVDYFIMRFMYVCIITHTTHTPSSGVRHHHHHHHDDEKKHHSLTIYIHHILPHTLLVVCWLRYLMCLGLIDGHWRQPL